ncbi:hypothetical protein RKE29_02575 [Streptomyces sp. B1866]|uniref:hypothetical protein n=1 Tax=Streptomyces sp. B1866 TaxID=3075431 RepID=UPI00289061B3|nr:hypothetical protein [Streptomyces sp. B1866]MDT3395543.1 hypothetical protein [Streptomyces sp. B1866]
MLLTLTIFTICLVIVGSASMWAWLADDPATPFATATGMLAFVGVLLAPVRGVDEPPWPRSTLLALPTAIALVGLTALIVRHHENHRPIDITNKIKMVGADGLTNGGTATATFHVDDSRPWLRITFQVADHRPELPDCHSSPHNKLTVRSTKANGQQDTFRTSPGRSVDIGLGPGLHDGKLAVELETETNCELDISVEKGILHD